MEFIEYRGFKNIFIGLAQEDEKYFIIYGQTNPAQLCITDTKEEIYAKGYRINSFITDKHYEINIPFIPNNITIHMVNITNKQTYKVLSQILEDLQ